MLIGHEQFMGELLEERTCWIGGGFSRGKTSLAMQIAESYLKQGYKFISNTKCVWNDDDVHLITSGPDAGTVRAVVVLDEVGRKVKLRRQVEEMMSYAAKMDLVLLGSSKSKPCKEFSNLHVTSGWNTMGAGIPLIIYKWEIQNGGFRDEGTFYSWSPWSVWGIYSRRSAETSTERLIHQLRDLTNEFIEYDAGQGDREAYELPVMEDSKPEAEILDYVAATEAMDEAIDNLTAVVRRKKRR